MCQDQYEGVSFPLVSIVILSEDLSVLSGSYSVLVCCVVLH